MNKQTKKTAAATRGGGGNKSFYLIIAAIVVLGGAGLVIAGMNRDEVMGPMSLADTEVEADPGVGISEGAPDAPATLVEFSDYQCPHCASFNGFTGRLLRQNYVSNGMLRWTVYEFPLEHFQNAIPAALAARCAGDQDRFWEMRDMLFANQRQWATQSNPRRTFEGYAADIGLDKNQFSACYSDRTHLAAIMSAPAASRSPRSRAVFASDTRDPTVDVSWASPYAAAPLLMSASWPSVSSMRRSTTPAPRSSSMAPARALRACRPASRAPASSCAAHRRRAWANRSRAWRMRSSAVALRDEPSAASVVATAEAARSGSTEMARPASNAAAAGSDSNAAGPVPASSQAPARSRLRPRARVVESRVLVCMVVVSGLVGSPRPEGRGSWR